MRLKAQLWVAAYIKICAVNSLMALVARHGDDDAGTIFIRINHLDGMSKLFVPAPAGLTGTELDRRWQLAFEGAAVADEDIESYLEREAMIDSDLWIVEVESREGQHHLEAWLATT